MKHPGLLTPLAVALCVAAPARAQVQAAGVPYRNPALTVEERVADLVGRMTLEEKVGQLMMSDARSEDLSFINTRQPGSVLHILGAKVARAMDLAAQNRLGCRPRPSARRLASPTLARGQAAAVLVDVENAGPRAGDEIVQVYVSDVVTSATWVNKALEGFARVHLAAGEKKTVEVALPWEAFQIVDAGGRSVVEPGEFEVLVGPSSRDRDLLKATLRAE
jgi:hypothetical protein